MAVQGKLISNVYIPTERLTRINESQTLAMAARVRELKAQGKEVYSFTLGEPDFDTPRHIRDAAIEAINEGDTHYPPVAGILKLKEAVCNFYDQQFHVKCNPKQVVVSTGGKQSLLNALMSLVNPGDEVIIPAPYWVSYLPMTQMAEGKPIILIGKDENNLKITPEQLENAITPKTKVVIFNSPSNPTGIVYSEDEIIKFVEIFERHPHVYIISDEIYALIRFGVSFLSLGTFESLKSRIILINGVSKAFAMTGWRIGVMIAPENIAAMCEKYQGQITSGACSIAQRAALKAFSSDLAPTLEMISAFEKRRDLAISLFHELTPNISLVKPDGAFYLYPNISYYLGKKTISGEIVHNPDDLINYLLESAHVATVSGIAFGTNEHIRLSYACGLDNIRQGITKLAEGLNQLK